MEPHFISSTFQLDRIGVCRRAFAIAVGLAALVFTEQAVAQGQILRESASQSREGIGVRQAAFSGDSTSLKLISAPVPAQGEASLPLWEEISFHSLEMVQNADHGTSQDATQTSAGKSNSAMIPATKTKPQHRALGLTLIIVGTTALAAGVTLYVGEQHSYCNSSSNGCNEAKDTGIALMPIGGGVAITGFYLRFRR